LETVVIDQSDFKIECGELLASLYWALDSGDNNAAVELFSEDAKLVVSNVDISGKALKDYFLSRSGEVLTRHIISNAVIAADGPETASGRAYVMLYRLPKLAGDLLPGRLPSMPQALGDLILGFRKTSAGWRFTYYESRPVLVAEPEPSN
jgi:hypothetical protein